MPSQQSTVHHRLGLASLFRCCAVSLLVAVTGVGCLQFEDDEGSFTIIDPGPDQAPSPPSTAQQDTNSSVDGTQEGTTGEDRSPGDSAEPLDVAADERSPVDQDAAPAASGRPATVGFMVEQDYYVVGSDPRQARKVSITDIANDSALLQLFSSQLYAPELAIPSCSVECRNAVVDGDLAATAIGADTILTYDRSADVEQLFSISLPNAFGFPADGDLDVVTRAVAFLPGKLVIASSYGASFFGGPERLAVLDLATGQTMPTEAETGNMLLYQFAIDERAELMYFDHMWHNGACLEYSDIRRLDLTTGEVTDLPDPRPGDYRIGDITLLGSRLLVGVGPVGRAGTGDCIQTPRSASQLLTSDGRSWEDYGSPEFAIKRPWPPTCSAFHTVRSTIDGLEFLYVDEDGSETVLASGAYGQFIGPIYSVDCVSP